MHGLLLVVALDAAVIALWLDTRFEPHTPQTVARTLVHTAAAVLALELAPTLIALIIAEDYSPARRIAALFAVLLVLTYLWLASICC